MVRLRVTGPRWRVAAVLLLPVVLVTGACSPATEDPAATTTTPAPTATAATTETSAATTTVVAAGETCEPATAEAVAGAGVSDAVTTASDGSEVWGFFYTDAEAGDPIAVWESAKILWRIVDDDDDLTEPTEPVIHAVGPGGTVIGPIGGPFFHSGSNWDRPGYEWGTGWLFPEPGCWTMRISSGEATAELSIDVTTWEATVAAAGVDCPSGTVTAPSTVGGHEALAESDDLEARVLLWTAPPLPVGEEVRVYWSIAGGEGRPTVTAIAPDGSEVAPTWGPGGIGPSNWDHEGDEWEASFVLPSPGCWELIVTMGGGSASVMVAAG